ncbi:MAG: transketolase [Candidatus Midichloriaceae bacterium]|jgi:transketolase
MNNTPINIDLHKKLSTALRILSVEMVDSANSGHPGMPLGFADVATVLAQHFLQFNPNDALWENRDRFILSAGHGSALLYSLLFLLGYKDYTIEDLKKFRDLDSITPGHPEFNPKLGIETTTGPLGQGLANAVGMAIAQKKANADLNNILDNKIYAVVGDGCLMEGISHETMSLAGHLCLNNLIVLFDDNKISIDGPTSLTTSDMTLTRVSSYNWNVISVDGHNPDAIYNSLKIAQKSDKPTFISCRTKIGFSSPNFESSEESHGKNLGIEEINLIKKKLNWNHPAFTIPDDIINVWRDFYKRNLDNYNLWIKNHRNTYNQFFTNNLNVNKAVEKISDFKKDLLLFNDAEATRKSSHKTLEQISSVFAGMIGGSADLTGSNCTKSKLQNIIHKDDFSGNYLHYGIREHAMVAIMNGIKVYCDYIPYGGTFLVFSDYCRPAIRLAALMNLPIILIFSHDSIGVGEDGPTHQPIEHLSSLRSIPNINVLRPADAIETAECWEIMLKEKEKPSILCLTRQNIPQFRNKINIDNDKNLCSLGAYAIYQSTIVPQVHIFATGSEVSIALEVSKILEDNGVGSKVISVPSQEIFWQQSSDYKMEILCNKGLKVAIEAGSDQSWYKFIGAHGMFFGINTFGKSAKIQKVYDYFELNSKKISEKILKSLN